MRPLTKLTQRKPKVCKRMKRTMRKVVRKETLLVKMRISKTWTMRRTVQEGVM